MMINSMVLLSFVVNMIRKQNIYNISKLTINSLLTIYILYLFIKPEEALINDGSSILLINNSTLIQLLMLIVFDFFFILKFKKHKNVQKFIPFLMFGVMATGFDILILIYIAFLIAVYFRSRRLSRPELIIALVLYTFYSSLNDAVIVILLLLISIFILIEVIKIKSMESFLSVIFLTKLTVYQTNIDQNYMVFNTLLICISSILIYWYNREILEKLMKIKILRILSNFFINAEIKIFNNEHLLIEHKITRRTHLKEYYRNLNKNFNDIGQETILVILILTFLMLYAILLL